MILRKLAGADPDGKRHCVRLLRTFEYRHHLCLVFESMARLPPLHHVVLFQLYKDACMMSCVETMSRGCGLACVTGLAPLQALVFSFRVCKGCHDEALLLKHIIILCHGGGFSSGGGAQDINLRELTKKYGPMQDLLGYVGFLSNCGGAQDINLREVTKKDGPI